MKTLLKRRSSHTFIALIFSLFASSAFAWASTTPMEKLYTFKFKLSKETYEYSQKSTSYEEAFEKAAQSCFNHYKDGKKLTENQGLDIIDVCANPRS